MVRILTGQRGEAVAEALRCAEDDEGFLGTALRALEKLDTLDKRHVWSLLGFHRSAVGLCGMTRTVIVVAALSAYPAAADALRDIALAQERQARTFNA